MSSPYEITYSPERSINWTNVQFADHTRVAVADFSNIQYFQPSESEEEEDDDDEDESEDGDSQDEDGEGDEAGPKGKLDELRAGGALLT